MVVATSATIVATVISAAPNARHESTSFVQHKQRTHAGGRTDRVARGPRSRGVRAIVKHVGTKRVGTSAACGGPCSELFRQKRVWNRSVQKRSTRNTSFHFDTVRRRRPPAGAHAAGPPTLPHDGPAPPGEPPGRRTESNPAVKSAKEQTCAWPPASESLHTYSCTRSTHVAASACMAACMHGRAHGTTKKRLHEPHRSVRVARGTCNHQCLEHFVRNTYFARGSHVRASGRNKHFDTICMYGSSAPAGSAVQK